LTSVTVPTIPVPVKRQQQLFLGDLVASDEEPNEVSFSTIHVLFAVALIVLAFVFMY